jgi:hypothetical protein
MNPPGAPVLDLRDVHAPPLPGFWPPAPGWWVAAALLTGLLVYVAVRLFRAYRRHRQRQQVLGILDGLVAGYTKEDAVGFVTGVSMLLRRVALRRFPRRFLDETGGGAGFSRGAGRVLADGPYAARVEVDPEELATLARAWIRRNFGVANES